MTISRLVVVVKHFGIRFGLVAWSLCRSEEVWAFKRAQLRLFNRLNRNLLTGSLDQIFLTWRSIRSNIPYLME